MSTKKKMLWLLSLLPFFIACGDDNTDIPDWPWAEPETPTEPVEANPDIVNLGWTNVKEKRRKQEKRNRRADSNGAEIHG